MPVIPKDPPRWRLTGEGTCERGAEPEEVSDGLQPLEEEHLLHYPALAQAVQEEPPGHPHLPHHVHLLPGGGHLQRAQLEEGGGTPPGFNMQPFL